MLKLAEWFFSSTSCHLYPLMHPAWRGWKIHGNPLTGLEPQCSMWGLSFQSLFTWQVSTPEHPGLHNNMTASSKRVKQKLPDLLTGLALTHHHFSFILLVRVSEKPVQIQGGGKQTPPINERSHIIDRREGLSVPSLKTTHHTDHNRDKTTREALSLCLL